MGVKKLLVVVAFALLGVLTVPTVASAWGLPPAPVGCKSWGEWLVTGGACRGEIG